MPPDSNADAGEARRVLDFWFGPEGSPERGQTRPLWFMKDDALDRTIAESFGPLIERALRGELEAWSGEPDTALAQIIVLDQFTRNVFRGTPRAFAGDPRGLAAARALVGSGHDAALAPLQRVFVYMPFEHAEGIEMQEQALRLFERLAAAAPETTSFLDFARRHHAIIERFGRFPHRNAVMGRRSTVEEVEFLKQPGSGF